MRKQIFIWLVIVFGTHAFAAKKIDKKEHKQLIVQCQAIRARILQENNFDGIRQNPIDFSAIRKMEERRFQTEIMPRIMEQAFGRNPNSFGGAQQYQVQKAKDNFNTQLAAMEAQFKAEQEGRYLTFQAKIRALIIQTITDFLHTINTKTSNHLLAELIANGFNF